MKRRGVLIFLLIVFLVLSIPTFAGMQRVSGLFSETHYEEARQSLVNSGEGSRSGEEILWRSRLSSDPNQATALLQGSLDDPDIPQSTRIGMSLQLAQIFFARGQYEKVNSILNPLFEADHYPLPGEIYLLAGLTLRKAGNFQKAREMLASVKPEDQAFGAARYFLGDIGLQNNDPELALRYFESGQKNATGQNFSRLKAGQWRALRAIGEDQDAERLLLDLQQQSPGCLALVEIDRVLQQENDENSARIATAAATDIDTVLAQPVNNVGRYSLQVGAFSDRGLALEFKRQHQEQIPQLHITEERNSMGQFLYKLRFGSFVNPALARSEAIRQKKRLGMDVIVIELDSKTNGR